MFQQIIALLVILFFIIRLLSQKKRKQIGGNEFVFWLIFWIFSMAVIASLKWIDKLVASLGFSGSGIEVILYIAVLALFYFIFRVRIKLEKIERDMTKIVREIALNNKNIKI